MRNEDEIQRAHDVTHFLCRPHCRVVFDDPRSVQAAHDVLAWVLGFPCGEGFAGNLAGAIEALRAADYQEEEAGTAISAEEAQKRGLSD